MAMAIDSEFCCVVCTGTGTADSWIDHSLASQCYLTFAYFCFSYG